jgi:hypothetical protein
VSAGGDSGGSGTDVSGVSEGLRYGNRLGGGKLLTPQRQRRGEQNGTEGESNPTDLPPEGSSIPNDGHRGLSVPELVSELVYSGKTLADIAGYDNYQFLRVICRRRDRYGKLVRGEELPEWVEVDEDGMRTIGNPVPYEVMYKQVKTSSGMERDQAERSWEQFLEEHPRFGVGGEDF